MNKRTYLLASFLMFVAIVTGSDLYARITIAGEVFAHAISEHFRWASMTIVGLFFLFAPFAGVALICCRANRRGRTRSVLAIFCFAILCLGYFYFNGFQSAQHAMIMKRWTAAALSIGLLPFYTGIPLLLFVFGFVTLIARLDPRRLEEPPQSAFDADTSVS
jgi:hypothetical protein